MRRPDRARRDSNRSGACAESRRSPATSPEQYLATGADDRKPWRTSQGASAKVKFALMLSTLEFDSAIRGYLTTPLALRFLGAGETRDRESSRVPAGGPGALPALLASQPRGKGRVASLRPTPARPPTDSRQKRVED